MRRRSRLHDEKEDVEDGAEKLRRSSSLIICPRIC